MLHLLHLLQEFAHTFLTLFYTYELPVLFLATLLEEAGLPIPIPADTLVALAGTKPSASFSHALATIALASLAALIGSSILFCIMKSGGRSLLTRYGHILHINPAHLESMEKAFAHHGRWIIVGGRLLPGLRIISTIVAGLSGMTYVEFAVTTSVAAVVWATFYYTLGGVLKRELPHVWAILSTVVGQSPPWALVLAGVLLVAGCGLVGSWLLGRVRHQQAISLPKRPLPVA